MYEKKSIPPLPRDVFARRMVVHIAVAVGVLLGSLGLGMIGYHGIEKLSWMDAFLNSAMLLGGMGPVDAPKTEGGKLFAGLYALYAGLVFLVTVAIVFAPIVHRVMHKFHWPDGE